MIKKKCKIGENKKSNFSYKTENGLLSYENPNYHMDPQRIERNSHLYEEILSELQQQNSLSKSHMVSNRKDYGRLDIGSMGVDRKENFRYVYNYYIMYKCRNCSNSQQKKMFCFFLPFSFL